MQKYFVKLTHPYCRLVWWHLYCYCSKKISNRLAQRNWSKSFYRYTTTEWLFSTRSNRLEQAHLKLSFQCLVNLEERCSVWSDPRMEECWYLYTNYLCDHWRDISLLQLHQWPPRIWTCGKHEKQSEFALL